MRRGVVVGSARSHVGEWRSRHVMAGDMQVVQQYWGSVEEDTVVADRDSGIHVDAHKMHNVGAADGFFRATSASFPISPRKFEEATE